MGKKSKAKETEEQALARRLAKALGLEIREIVDPNADYPDDMTWIFFSPKRNSRVGYWVDAVHPIFGNDADYGLVDREWIWNRDDSGSKPVPIPKWLTKRMTLEEIDLRLATMGF